MSFTIPSQSVDKDCTSSSGFHVIPGNAICVSKTVIQYWNASSFKVNPRLLITAQHAIRDMSMTPNFPASAPLIPAPTILLPASYCTHIELLGACRIPCTFYQLYDFVYVLLSVQNVFVFPFSLHDYESPFKTKLRYQFLWKLPQFGSNYFLNTSIISCICSNIAFI